MRWFGFGVFVAALSATGFDASAHAQSDTLMVSDTMLELLTESEKTSRAEHLERAYGEVKLAGPRAGVGASTFVVAGGLTAILMGTARVIFETTFFCPSDDPRCGEPSAGSAAIVGVGLAAVIGGAVGLALTTRKLRGRKKERRRIRREIGELQGFEEGAWD